MKKVFFTVVGAAILVAIALFVNLNKDYHYVLLHPDGTITPGRKTLSFDKIEWKSSPEVKGIFLPTIKGDVVLCKVGDKEGAMYTYHPFKVSNMKDFNHNVSTVSGLELKYHLPRFKAMSVAEGTTYQAVVKIKRYVGGLSCLERDLVEGRISLPMVNLQ